jgi:UDP-N-acetyl-D-glucosamine dehydrogenase
VSFNETPAARLRQAISDRTATVAVVGLGYVGLPMALEFVRAGFPVVGLENDEGRCAALRAGQSYIADLSDAELQAALREGRFTASTDTSLLAKADVVLICVPTPLRKSKDPDLTAILAAGQAVASHLRAGQVIVLESTTYPGTTEEILLPLFAPSGLEVGKDYFLAFSPERVDPGNRHYGVRDITKLVGGVTPGCTEVSAQLYAQVIGQVIPVDNPRVAEAAKLLENTFRSVNIALANEMAIICRHLGIDVWAVIDAAGTKPFGFMAHYPGPGIGGHCIPLDPHYLSWKARLSGYEPRLISLASDINGSMPHHVVELIVEELNRDGRAVRGSRIAVLGVAYKPNVGDTRESPAVEILQKLESWGARITYCDPHVPSLRSGGRTLEAAPLSQSLLEESDCVVVLTHHSDFDFGQVARHARLVIDTRNATRRYPAAGRVRYL